MSRLEIFISVGPDLEREREAIGRAITALPISLGWVIKCTPRQGEALEPALAVVRSCHFYLFILGQDISAPTGVEWNMAVQAGKRPLAYRKDILRTPAARIFQVVVGTDWQEFHTPQELALLLQKALARHLVDGAERYGVSLTEWENLAAFLKELEERETEVQGGRKQGQEGFRGAGEGGIIVSPERDLPPGGVLVGEFSKWEAIAHPRGGLIIAWNPHIIELTSVWEGAFDGGVAEISPLGGG